MEVFNIVKMFDKNQQQENKEIEIRNKNKQRRGENLSFNYVQNLMKHDSFRRHKGAIKQVGWSDNEDM